MEHDACGCIQGSPKDRLSRWVKHSPPPCVTWCFEDIGCVEHPCKFNDAASPQNQRRRCTAECREAAAQNITSCFWDVGFDWWSPLDDAQGLGTKRLRRDRLRRTAVACHLGDRCQHCPVWIHRSQHGKFCGKGFPVAMGDFDANEHFHLAGLDTW